MNPAKFAREVRQEASRVIWPSRRETLISSAIVLVLAGICSLFLVLVDNIVSMLVQWILGIGG